MGEGEGNKPSEQDDSVAGAVPLYGEQTRLALHNFPRGGRSIADIPEFVRAYALVKLACVRANVELEIVDVRRGEAIARAAQRVAELKHVEEFPTPLIQGGGGTSTNMNMNEVIATLANADLERTRLPAEPPAPIHPNDHVNASQSTNDTYPTAMALALMDMAGPTLTALDRLREALLDQAQRGEGVRRLGRTCLQDAVVLTVADTHRAQATMVQRSHDLLRESTDRLRIVPLGGTVLGTGIGAPVGFGVVVVQWLRTLTNRDLEPPTDVFAAMAHVDSLATLANACAQAAIALARVATDLRWLAAGPRGGPAEVILPPLQAGSSIMPGKVNPVIPELVMQLSYRVRGSAYSIELAVASGELELNVMGPVIFDALTASLMDLRDAARHLRDRCVHGLRWDQHALERGLTGALDQVVDQAAIGGYVATSQAIRTRSSTGAPAELQGGAG